MNMSYTILISLIVALNCFLLGFDNVVISGAVKGITLYVVMTEWMLGLSVGCVVFRLTIFPLYIAKLEDKPVQYRVLLYPIPVHFRKSSSNPLLFSVPVSPNEILRYILVP